MGSEGRELALGTNPPSIDRMLVHNPQPDDR